MKEYEVTLTIKVEEEIMEQYDGIEDLIYRSGEEAPENGDVKEMITQEVFDEIVLSTRDDDKIRALGNCDGELLISIKK